VASSTGSTTAAGKEASTVNDDAFTNDTASNNSANPAFQAFQAFQAFCTVVWKASR